MNAAVVLLDEVLEDRADVMSRLQVGRRLHAVADAGGGCGENQVARSQSDELAAVRHQIRGAEHPGKSAGYSHRNRRAHRHDER